MARTRDAGYEDQRRMILAHAAHLFARQGYAATSMNEVADACGLAKASLYHYYRDKYSLLNSIADTHVSRLRAVVAEVGESGLAPRQELRELIRRFLAEYSDAKDAHRVLTEDVRFLAAADRARVLGKEREVVAGFANAIARVRPQLRRAALVKPLTMLLFGMINWMFTWMNAEGPLDYDAMAPVVADLFLGGVGAVKLTRDVATSIG
ncbi:MAG TPA: TetR/AcrR family transcriptional regulator [Steroidobacteraceae bacterium]|jgi:AcrR family transcriptional regulator|nr:TetR/AcrR family transcriptional regulator [Steroidobacteraceae bacterium]